MNANQKYWTCPNAKCSRQVIPRLSWQNGRYYGTCGLCYARIGVLTAAEVEQVARRRQALKLPTHIDWRAACA